MKTTISCPECHGKGNIPLPYHLAMTLGMLRTPKTATELGGLIPSISASSFSNRLAELMALGFVKREREGKFWRYSRA